MNKRDLKKFEKLLAKERDHLVMGLRKIEEENLYDNANEIRTDLSSYAESGSDNFDRETALNIASTESDSLRDVGDALKRIEDGSYGDCEGCGEGINKKRLEAMPSARYCIECQSRLERDGFL